MRSADGGSRYAVPFSVIPARGQITKDAVESANKEPWHVFHDDDARSYCANDSRELRPQPACVGLSALRSGDADRLTGEPAANAVDGFQFVSSKVSDIGVPRDVGPMLREHGPTPRIDFNLPPHTKPGPLQSEIKAADP